MVVKLIWGPIFLDCAWKSKDQKLSKKEKQGTAWAFW